MKSVFSHDNKWIGSICDDGSCCIFNSDLNAKIYEFRVKNDAITQLSFNTDAMICSVVGGNGSGT